MTDEQKNLLTGRNFDVKGTLSRFMNKEELYERFLIKFLDDNNYSKLIKALEEKNYEEAYVGAHTLKGVAGNLGITDVFNCTVDILAKFKAQEYDSIDDILKRLTEGYSIAVETINSLK